MRSHTTRRALKDTLTAGGKKYDCEWVETRTTITMGDKIMAFEVKSSVCKDLPLGGRVRTDFGAGGAIGEAVPTGFGRGK